MEDISRLPSFRFSDSSDSNKHAEAPSSSDTSRNAGKTQSTKSPRLLSVIQSLQTPRSPSDGNLATNLREPLRATRSSSPDTDRAGLPAERTQSQSSTKNSRMMVKRTKTKKDTKSKKKWISFQSSCYFLTQRRNFCLHMSTCYVKCILCMSSCDNSTCYAFFKTWWRQLKDRDEGSHRHMYTRRATCMHLYSNYIRSSVYSVYILWEDQEWQHCIGNCKEQVCKDLPKVMMNLLSVQIVV